MGANKSKQRRSTQPAADKRTKREADLSSLPARVDRVSVSGLCRTKDDYVQRTAINLFKVNNFEDVYLESHKARLYLIELGIYKDVRVFIDVSKGKNATPNGYEVKFDGVEQSRITGTFGTEVGQNEGSLIMELATPNIWGRGERCSINGKYSSAKASKLSLKLTKPFLHSSMGDYKPEISAGVFRNTFNVPTSAFKTKTFGILADVSFLLLHTSNSFQYEASFRELFTLGKQSPFFVRSHCGPRMASLVRHICSYDSRDSIVFPSTGTFIKLVNEYSGLGGNISYLMNNFNFELNLPLFAKISAQVSSQVGIINTEKKSPDIPISNLFILGGPQSIRGFQYAGVGPHLDRIACGVHSYWAVGMHLWAPLPFHSYFGRFGNNFRTHFFYNCGNCDSFSLENMRSAAGLGIAFRLGERARIEFNYCFPLLRVPGDIPSRGFQFGIGYEFL